MTQVPRGTAQVLTRSHAVLTDNPEAYIARDRRLALASGTNLRERVRGAALFCDISGFTTLAETLAFELGPQRGAEELTRALDVVFGAVLGELLGWGGTVIYFSGDAVTCWLDGDDGARAAACALDMQTAMAAVGTMTTPAGTTMTLAMKVAIATGSARRFVVGDPRIQLIEVLAGSLMDRLAAVEHDTHPGEVAVDATTLERMGGKLVIAPARTQQTAQPQQAKQSEQTGIVTGLITEVERPPIRVAVPRLPDEVVQQWLLPSVWQRLRDGRGDFVGELRPTVPLFLRFGGIDFDHDEQASAHLNDFVSRAQHIVDGWGGNVLQLTIGDKGAYLYAVFGAPVAHEDDAARACAAALELMGLEDETAVTGIQIGIASGRTRSGTYGHEQRRTFCCLGDPVNLSARLMSSAAPGEIVVSAEVARAAGPGFDTLRLDDIRVKGKAQPIPVCALRGRDKAAWSRRRQSGHVLLGRDNELAQLAELADRAFAGNGQIIGIVAEAGMGKSHLTAEATRRWHGSGRAVHVGEASAIETAASYFAWRAVWAELLDTTGGEADLGSALRTALNRLDPGLLPRLPLLGTLFGVALPDSPLTRSFDGKLRKSSLEDLLVTCLRLRAARAQPFVLVLEDCHWLDPLSRDLLDVIARSVVDLPVLVMLTSRPGSFRLPAVPHATQVRLDRLDDASCRLLIADRLAELYDEGIVLPDALAARLIDRADGNPFHLEELLNYLHAQGIDPSDAAAVRGLELPASLSALVLGRIDILPEAPRRTLKVASVVGREFAASTLTAVYPDLGGTRKVRDQLHQLQRRQMVVREGNARGRAWAFRHAAVQEVAYESLPFALRSTLHTRAGEWVETTDPAALDLLAHHFARGDDPRKKRTYLQRAGEAAQARYANESAVDYYRQLVPLLTRTEQIPVLLRLGTVLELTGDWSAAETEYETARARAADADDHEQTAAALAALAECLRKQGRWEQAAGHLAAAVELFTARGDDAGLARVEHVRGTLCAQSGEYVKAREHYLASFAIRERLRDRAGMAALTSNLAIVAEYQGDYDAAHQLNERALRLRQEVGDPQAIAVSLNNLGMVAALRHDYLDARDRCSEALRLTREVGDTWLAAIALNNLGNAHRELREHRTARGTYREALDTYALLGDRWALAILYDDVAALAADAGDADTAVSLAAAAAVVHDRLGSPRSPAAQRDLDARLAPARAAVGERQATLEAQASGLGEEAIYRLALSYCSD